METQDILVEEIVIVEETVTAGPDMEGTYQVVKSKKVVEAYSDHKFFVEFLKNQKVIRKAFDSLVYRKYPCFRSEKEDRWSDVLLVLKKRKSLEKYDEKLGEFSAYAYWQVLSILNGMFRIWRTSIKNEIPARYLDCDEMETRLGNVSTTTLNPEKSDLQEELEKIFSADEQKVFEQVILNDMLGYEAAEALGTNGMHICRKLKSIRDKARKYVSVHGIA